MKKFLDNQIVEKERKKQQELDEKKYFETLVLRGIS